MSTSSSNSIELHPDYISVINEKALLETKNQELEAENKKLNHNILLLKKSLYGSNSERLTVEQNPLQEGLFPKELSTRPVAEREAEIEIKPHKRKKRKPYKDANGNDTQFPPELARQEIALEPEGAAQ